MKLAGWGRMPEAECRMITPGRASEIAGALPEDGTLIARGMGRAYGDSALNPGAVIDMRRLNRMLSFDAANGLLVAEAGVVLADIIDVFLPRGFFPPVTPGTKFVTLGGMIAADVHGKNHHQVGSLGNFIDWIELIGADNQLIRCSRDENAALFHHSIGGMGLTGVILRAALRLQRVESGWIRQKTIAYEGLEALLEGLAVFVDHPYSVAWVDCLARGGAIGRSLLYLGEHAAVDELPARHQAAPFHVPQRKRLTVPCSLPSFTLNRYSVRLFNSLIYAMGKRAAARGSELVDYDRYFYPLDRIHHWNRIYGRKGLMQFQTVLPPDQAAGGLHALLQATAEAGQGSFLSVLKKFGPQESAFSFPMAGSTLTLDFPVNKGTMALVDKLTEIAISHGGRFYLAKDARLSAAAMAASDERAAAFAAFRRAQKLEARFSSLQSERLGL